jgi:hypothetical protein
LTCIKVISPNHGHSGGEFDCRGGHEMRDQSVLKRHAALVDTMAQALGVDLQEAALEGVVSVDQLSDAVLRCTDCGQIGACDSWLDTRKTGVPEPRTPNYCRNAGLFRDLVKGAQ